MDEAAPQPNQIGPHALKSALPRTWGAFFRRHGGFTPAQLAAIPPLLVGENVLLCAPTASGKTEAAIAPLIERHLPTVRPTPRLAILYLLPTRALISDVKMRLAAPLEALRVTSAVKTHDLSSFDPKRPADLLLTTPESLDALFAKQAKTLSGVQAVIIDELHVFDGSVRGDQLRVLLNRLRQVRAHAYRMGEAENGDVQCVGLSATLRQPQSSAERYLCAAEGSTARVVKVQGSREIEAEQIYLDEDTPGALLDYLKLFRERGWRKAIAFCNTRTEVESYATAVRSAGSPFGEAVYVHYSNLEWERRQEIERQFAQAQAAICFASSTLELGIDVGDIDVTLLIGAPGSTEAFVQRAGRANRRRRTARVACFYRTPLERTMFGALLDAEDHAAHATPNTGDERRAPDTEVSPELLGSHSSAFRPSVAVQQIFSLLQQSPTGAVRPNPLVALFAGMLSAPDVEAVLGKLQALGYLQSGRAGEWRAGEHLNKLVDLQMSERTELSLHSNIPTAGATHIKIRDQYSRRVIATVDRQWLDRDLITLEGRPLAVEWYDGESLWVSAYRGSDSASHVRYLSVPHTLSYELASQLSAQVSPDAATAPLVPHEDGWLWFHWLGDVYGQALFDLLSYTLPVARTPQPGLCLLLLDELRSMPTLTVEQVKLYLHDYYQRYEPAMRLGAYHHLLPTELRRRAVVEQFDVPRFVHAVEQLHTERAPEAIALELQQLLLAAPGWMG